MQHIPFFQGIFVLCYLPRLVALLYELLGPEADALVRWPAKSGSSSTAAAALGYVDAKAALERLLAQQDWPGARRCRASLGIACMPGTLHLQCS